MNRFNSKIGAVALVGLAAIYMIISLATGRSAASEPPADLSAPQAGVDVWQATALMSQHDQNLVIVDARQTEHFKLFHLPNSVSKPGASASDVLVEAEGKTTVLIVGNNNAESAQLAGEVFEKNSEIKTHFLKDGVRSWYLAYVVPIELFNEKEPPYGWKDAMSTARSFVNTRKGDRAEVIQALGKLSNAGYTPTQLQGKKKSSGKKKKKITGGCG